MLNDAWIKRDLEPGIRCADGRNGKDSRLFAISGEFLIASHADEVLPFAEVSVARGDCAPGRIGCRVFAGSPA